MRLHIERHKVTLINASSSIDESFFVDIQLGRVEKIAKNYDRPDLALVEKMSTPSQRPRLASRLGLRREVSIVQRLTTRPWRSIGTRSCSAVGRSVRLTVDAW
jgi:hypothetical protein